jgi:hypothetical protein
LLSVNVTLRSLRPSLRSMKILDVKEGRESKVETKEFRESGEADEK